MVTLFIGPLTEMAEEKSWPSTEWVILSTWLLNSSWAEVTFWWAPLSSHPLTIWRDLSTCFFPRCHSYQFSNHVLSNFLTIQPILWLATWLQKLHGFREQLHIWPFLFLDKMYDHVYCLKFGPVWRFLFVGVFQCPIKVCNAAATYFWVVTV